MIRHFIPDVIIPAAWIVFFSLVILRNNFFSGNGLKNKFFLFPFYLKIIFGLMSVWIYTHIYTDRSTSDIFRYYDTGIKLFTVFKENPSEFLKIFFGINLGSPEIQNTLSTFDNWGRTDHFSIFNDNQFMIRLNALMCFVSMGGYFTHLILFNFLSFVGLTAIFKVFARYYPEKEKLIYVSTFLIPSTLLWCSGVIKDSLIVCFLGSSIYFLDNCVTKPFVKSRVKNFTWFLFCVFLLMFGKSQVFIIALPAWMGIFISKKMKSPYCSLVFPVTLIIYFAALVNMKMISPSLDFLKVLSDKQADFIGQAQDVRAGSYIELPHLTPDILSFIKNLPSALTNSFTRPWLSESRNAFMMLSAVEILALLLLLITAMFFPDRENFKFNPFLFFAITYIVFLFAMIGLVTPVLGALVRYRAHALPFLAIIICVLTDFGKIRDAITLKVSGQIQPS